MNRVFLFFLFVQLFIHAQLDAQKIYYVRQEANFDGTIVGCFDIATCSDSTICRVKEFWAFDIAVCPNGSIYIDGWGVDNEQLLTLPGVALLNVPDSSYSIVMPFNNGHNSCTCSAEGVIYSSGYDVWSYNTNTGVADSLGSFELNTQLAGDLSFYNGQLIGIDPNKNILAIDLNDPSMSPVLYTYSTTLPIPAIGMVTLAQNCDSAVVYLSFSDEDGGVTQHDPINQLYKLNLPDSTITFVCTMPRGVGGMASLEEGIASDCSVRLDLDNNDSSGAPDSDYRYDAWCGNSGVAICDVDAEVYSGYRIDSLRLRMLSPVPDGGSEFLSVGFLPDPVGVSGQNSQWLSLVRTSVPISDEVVAAGAFEEALKSVLLYNMNPVPTAGSRQIEVILFAQGNRSDTVDVPEKC